MYETQLTRLLEAIKVDKDIKDESLDLILKNFIGQAASLVSLYVGEDTLPPQLEVVVIRMTEAHYVQAMSDADGVKAYSEEGASWSFNDSEMQPYLSLLERYIDNRDGRGSKGGVWSW